MWHLSSFGCCMIYPRSFLCMSLKKCKKMCSIVCNFIDSSSTRNTKTLTLGNIRTWCPSRYWYFDRIWNWTKIWSALVKNVLNRSQQNFAYIMTAKLWWHVRNFVVISRVHFKPEHCKFWLNFEFDWKTISGMGARASWARCSPYLPEYFVAVQRGSIVM